MTEPHIADGAPPPDQDPIAIHFAEHLHGPANGCRMCDDALLRLLEIVRGERPIPGEDDD